MSGGHSADWHDQNLHLEIALNSLWIVWAVLGLAVNPCKCHIDNLDLWFAQKNCQIVQGVLGLAVNLYCSHFVKSNSRIAQPITHAKLRFEVCIWKLADCLDSYCRHNVGTIHTHLHIYTYTHAHAHTHTCMIYMYIKR